MDVPLLSLPGRAGLDLGLSLSVFIDGLDALGTYVYFDEDRGFPSPGFSAAFDYSGEIPLSSGSVNVYLLAAAGNRVELRQVGSSNVYEAGDSSYTATDRQWQSVGTHHGRDKAQLRLVRSRISLY